ncbi:MAG TPA: DUF3014 domain-containing protein [Casimicrobiaceae bacterium]|jgi:hypothetical protein|nr:DUF3014 domain-containing protein [Casimicrobiaceae bacterium]
MASRSAADEAHRLDPADHPTGYRPALAADADSRPIRAPRRDGTTRLVWVVLALVVLAALAYFLWQRNQSNEAIPPVSDVPAQVAPAAADAAPAINHPIEQARAAAPPSIEQKPLPALMVSDTTMQNTLADLFGSAALGRIFYEDAIVHRFVTTVDNLPRKTLPLRYLPVKPPGGGFVTTGSDEALAIGADNAARYAPYVRLVDAVDAKTLAGIYVHFYPLMQQDYRALGYPNGYFNDRLVQAIDDLLAAPDITVPPALAQPKVLYVYSDPELESRSAGQKIMMRMGSENSARLKAKLREIRAEITAPGNADLRKK